MATTLLLGLIRYNNTVIIIIIVNNLVCFKINQLGQPSLLGEFVLAHNGLTLSHQCKIVLGLNSRIQVQHGLVEFSMQLNHIITCIDGF